MELPELRITGDIPRLGQRLFVALASFAGLLCATAIRSEAQVVPPITMGFELCEGFTQGDLNSQAGWNVSQGSALVLPT